MVEVFDVEISLKVWICGKFLDLYFVQSNAKYNIYIISKINLNILRQIHGFPMSLTNRRCVHSIVVKVGLYIRSSKKYRALWENHDFFHARPRWKYSHVFAVLSGSVAEEFKCSSKFCGQSMANLWFPFSLCQNEVVLFPCHRLIEVLFFDSRNLKL